MLEGTGIKEFFDTEVTWQQGKAKPRPGGVKDALNNLEIKSREQGSAWYIGDTLDDMQAALNKELNMLGFLTDMGKHDPVMLQLYSTRFTGF